MKYLITALTLILSGCGALKDAQPKLRVITDACASGYIDRVRSSDDNSSIDVKCQNKNVMRITPFRP